jgi:hypothetical protein
VLPVNKDRLAPLAPLAHKVQVEQQEPQVLLVGQVPQAPLVQQDNLVLLVQPVSKAQPALQGQLA